MNETYRKQWIGLKQTLLFHFNIAFLLAAAAAAAADDDIDDDELMQRPAIDAYGSIVMIRYHEL